MNSLRPFQNDPLERFRNLNQEISDAEGQLQEQEAREVEFKLELKLAVQIKNAIKEAEHKRWRSDHLDKLARQVANPSDLLPQLGYSVADPREQATSGLVYMSRNGYETVLDWIALFAYSGNVLQGEGDIETALQAALEAAQDRDGIDMELWTAGKTVRLDDRFVAHLQGPLEYRILSWGGAESPDAEWAEFPEGLGGDPAEPDRGL